MPWQPFVYGGFAAVTAEIASYPMDLSKIRLQVQGQVADKSMTKLKYRGMAHALFKIGKNEGIGALYNGYRFAALRQATYGTIRFGIFFNVQQWWHSKGGKDDLAFLLPLGALAGFLASFVTTPFDILKIRCQATEQIKPKPIFKTLHKIYQNQGVAGLYQGKWPNSQRAAVVNGVQIPVYVVTKNKLMSLGFQDNPGTHLISGAVTTVFGALCSLPFDVIKTRIMQQRTNNDKIRVYKGSINAVYITVKHEGVFALWKGLIPAVCKIGPWNIVFWATLEQCRLLDNYMYGRTEAVF